MYNEHKKTTILPKMEHYVTTAEYYRTEHFVYWLLYVLINPVWKSYWGCFFSNSRAIWRNSSSETSGIGWRFVRTLGIISAALINFAGSTGFGTRLEICSSLEWSFKVVRFDSPSNRPDATLFIPCCVLVVLACYFIN